MDVRGAERSLLHRLATWLGHELGQEFILLGQPDSPSYDSILDGVRSLPHQVDGEMRGRDWNLAVEHTRILSVEDQVRRQKWLGILRQAADEVSDELPAMSHIHLAVDYESLGELKNTRQVQTIVSRFKSAVGLALAQLPQPRRGVTPRIWNTASPITFEIKQHLCPGPSRLVFMASVGSEIEEAIREAIANKAQKRPTFESYRSGGWRTLLLLERLPFNIGAPWDYVPLARQILTERGNRGCWDYCVIADITTGTPSFFWAVPEA
jgi:hypothetical protein